MVRPAVRLEWVCSERVQGIWPAVEHWITEACEEEGGSYLPSDVRALVVAGAWQMWIVTDGPEIHAMAITRIEQTPRRKVCWVLMMVGSGIEGWAHFRDRIAEWARAEGCGAVKSLARRGYVKMFKEFECRHVLLERNLDV